MFVIVQLRPLSSRQTCIGVELVGALESLALLQALTVQALNHKDRRFGGAVVQHGKAAEAQFALMSLQLQRGRTIAGEKLRALRKLQSLPGGRSVRSVDFAIDCRAVRTLIFKARPAVFAQRIKVGQLRGGQCLVDQLFGGLRRREAATGNEKAGQC